MSLKQEVQHTVNVANLAYAMMAAQNFDTVKCACGVAIMASVMVGTDPSARTLLAHELLRLAEELDEGLVRARRQ